MRPILRNISISAFINTLFILVITLLLVALFKFISWDKKIKIDEETTRYKLIANYLLSTANLSPSKEKEQRFYKEFHVQPVGRNENRLLSLTKGEIFFGGQSIYGHVEVVKKGDNKYIYLKRFGYNLVLKDMKPKGFRFEITILIATLIALLFLLLYIAIIRKITPLKKLNKQIEAFAQGDMNIKITQKSNDEIGKIAQSFDNALHHIRTLLDSKNLFMRNMMHELKTPITQGRIAIEMVEDGISKKTLTRAFERMNELIAELAQVERLTTQKFQPLMGETTLSEIIDLSCALLLKNKNNFDIHIEDTTITTDPKLLSLAIKNLIDNALKYGEPNGTEIVANERYIQVISTGQSLENPLVYYLEPFTQGEKRNSGFGLGLYIVHNIVNRLNYELNYFYKEGKNIFELRLEKR
jgi:two-component system OmpR family sensor kinase